MRFVPFSLRLMLGIIGCLQATSFVDAQQQNLLDCANLPVIAFQKGGVGGRVFVPGRPATIPAFAQPIYRGQIVAAPYNRNLNQVPIFSSSTNNFNQVPFFGPSTAYRSYYNYPSYYNYGYYYPYNYNVLNYLYGYPVIRNTPYTINPGITYYTPDRVGVYREPEFPSRVGVYRTPEMPDRTGVYSSW